MVILFVDLPTEHGDVPWVFLCLPGQVPIVENHLLDPGFHSLELDLAMVIRYSYGSHGSKK